MVRRPVNRPPPREEGLNDPLANVEQFNIIQFLQAEGEFNNIPMESFEQMQMIEQKPENGLHPQPMRDQAALVHQHANMVHQLQQQQLQQHQLQQQQQQQMYHQNPHVHMHPGLPMTPAITDLTRHGSSSSPSTTNSDPPYSPETLNQQFGLGTHHMSQGVIPNGQDLPSDLIPPHFQQQRTIGNSQVTSPPTAATFMPFLNSQQPTPASYVQSISPDSQCEAQGFAQTNLYNVLNVSSDESINGQSDDGHQSRKRARLEPPQPDPKIDPSFILSAALSGKFPPDIPDENGGQPNIKFYKYQEELWFPTYDVTGQTVQRLQIHVVADKGFNYSTNDNCFVNQKKNHFQVSVHVEAIDPAPPQVFKFNNQNIVIENFQLAFTGVKAESLTSEVLIRQSTTDRKPVLHTPVVFKIIERRMTKVTVPRLHFSETTLNNQRKNLRPNPDQKYFMLVVRLYAVGTCGTTVLVQSFASERVIVRATNPGSFEPPETVDATWSKNGAVLSTTGPVVIGNSNPRAQLTVDGDIYTSGRVVCPSDIRLKDNITEREAKEALENLQKLRIVDYFYKPEVAEKWGLTEEQRKRTGVIAQELAIVLPDAVKDLGDYLTVNESRVFYETVLATQELCRLTGDLDQKIDEKVEEISKRLTEYAQKKKMLTSVGSNLNSEGRSLNSSMSSLASSASALTAKNTKKNRRSSRRHRREPKSRFAYSTVIGLVGVMSFCLVAMSALYLLDWHNRNYGYHHASLPTSTSGPREGPGNLVIPLDHYVPLSQPDAPPLVPYCPANNCREYCCEDFDKEHDGTTEFDYDPSTVEDNDYAYKPETYSDFHLKKFGNDVVITLPDLNMQIDERYCIEKSCAKRKKVYNLFIPMTRYVPTVSFDVRLDIPISKTINNCGYVPEFENIKCGDTDIDSKLKPDSVPTSIRMFDNVFKVSAGEWTQSAYRYRVGYSTELCEVTDGTFGGFYEEYNLIFYRTCKYRNGTRPAV